MLHYAWKEMDIKCWSITCKPYWGEEMLSAYQKFSKSLLSVSQLSHVKLTNWLLGNFKWDRSNISL